MQSKGTDQVKYEDVSKQILGCPASSSTSFLLASEAHIRTHGKRDRLLGLEWWDAISTDVNGQKPRVLCFVEACVLWSRQKGSHGQ